MKKALLAMVAGLALAPSAHGGGPHMVLGAAEDIVKAEDAMFAKEQFDLLKLAGFNAVRVTSNWIPGQTAPGPAETVLLRNVSNAAKITGVRVYVSVFHPGSRTTPLTDETRAQFAQYAATLARRYPGFRDFVIGNEPNLNRFWMPQFNEDGSNAAAQMYLPLLAQSYDAIKAAAPTANVIGGAVSPRGEDRPQSIRHTHSPTTFIADLGAYYRASGRTLPIMDAFAIHPYQDNSSQDPTFKHPNTTTISINDYDKLVALLGKAFDGTAQKGSTLPLVYGEYGVESDIPPAKASLYQGPEPATTRPVDEATQAAYYKKAVELAFCQPNTTAMFLFHTADEPARAGWQSGVYYADSSPKASLPGVRAALTQSRRGIITRCEGLALTPIGNLKATVKKTTVSVQLTCDIDCTYNVRLERGTSRLATLTGRATGRLPRTLVFKRPKAGLYTVRAVLAAPVNPGPPDTPTLRVSIR